MLSMNISSKNFFKKLTFFCCLFNLSFNEYKYSATQIELTDAIAKTIDSAVQKTLNKGFIYELSLHAAKELIGKFIDKGFNWLFDLFYNYQQSFYCYIIIKLFLYLVFFLCVFYNVMI